MMKDTSLVAPPIYLKGDFYGVSSRHRFSLIYCQACVNM